MASRGVHCREPGLKVAAWAEGPLVQNSSGWPCQCVLRSWPDHLDWPHSGWYMLAVVLGCLFCPSLADGLPLPSLAGRLRPRAASVLAEALQQASLSHDNAERCALIVDPQKTAAPP